MSLTSALGAYTRAAPERPAAATKKTAPGAAAAPGGHAASEVGPRVEELLPERQLQGRDGVAGRAGTAPAVVDLSPEAISALAQKALETEVGEKIAAAFAEVGVDLTEGVGQDWSVDATAQRIVDFSTGLYDVFREQHSDLSEDEAKDLFEETIRGAVDEGYGEALEILRGMSMSDEILGQAEATITRVHELFDDFFAKDDQEQEDSDVVQEEESGVGSAPVEAE